MTMSSDPAWSSKKTPEMDERGQLIPHSGPDWLSEFDADIGALIDIPIDDLIIEGRDGTGPDDSKNRHARGHWEQDGHPLVRSIEPGESWRYCFADELLVM